MNDTQLDSILKQMAASDAPQLPGAAQIWFRAEIRRKARQRAQVEHPLLVMRIIAATICLLVVATLAFWNLPDLHQSLSSWFLFPLALSCVAMLTSAALAWSAMEPRQHRK